MNRKIAYRQIQLKKFERNYELLTLLDEKLNNCFLCNSPELYYLCYINEHDLLLNEETTQRLEEWIPLIGATYGYSEYNVESFPINYDYRLNAMCIKASHARKLKINTSKPVKHKRIKRCICSLILFEFPETISNESIVSIDKYLRDNNLEVADNPFIMVGPALHQKQKLYQYGYLYVPIK